MSRLQPSDGWDDEPEDAPDDRPRHAPGWPYPHDGSQYGVEGTLARVDAFAAGARRLTGARGLAVRAVVALLLVAMVGSVLAAALQGLRLLL